MENASSSKIARRVSFPEIKSQDSIVEKLTRQLKIMDTKCDF